MELTDVSDRRWKGVALGRASSKFGEKILDLLLDVLGLQGRGRSGSGMYR